MGENTLFKNINKLKQRVKKELLSNQNILKLVKYNVDDPLSEPDVDDAQSLLNDYIYLNPVVWDSVIDDTRTFILCNIRVAPTRNSQQFVDVYLYMYVICHNDIYDLENGETRVWNICDELMGSFNKTWGNGVGACQFRSMNEVTSRKDYYAVELQFVFTEFKI